MSAVELNDLLRRHPFSPFRVILTSGDRYDVRNPGLAVVMKSQLFIAFPGEDRYALCPFLHIAGVETLQPA